ncbi:MAG: CDP-glucose 4,6-dehydratase [Thermoguttaceae bacterium]
MTFFNNVYKDRRVFITGHTGFKGSWFLCALERLGAKCGGFSLPQTVSEPNHFALLDLSCRDIRGDVNDFSALQRAIHEFEPEIVFHLAAQPLVRLSYKEPLETFSTNVMGTVNLLESCKTCETIRSVVVITTDKVYENRENTEGYCEADRLGGFDPYAASKACAELVIASYRQSFYETTGKLLASARAGNVIGGGDWAEDRLLPDLVKAAVQNKTVQIRMPEAVRPWEHVLEPLFGYLRLGQCLMEGKAEFGAAWNFGPNPDGCVSVGTLVQQAGTYWNRIKAEFPSWIDDSLHETKLLYLNCEKAKTHLGWQPVWNFAETLRYTVDWYREFYENQKVLTSEQLERYMKAHDE